MFNIWHRMALITCGLFCSSIAHATILTLSPGLAFDNNAQTQMLLLETSPQNFSNQYVGKPMILNQN